LIKSKPCILNLTFPFELTRDQLAAIDAWVSNGYRGSIIYSTGTGKTEIAFECAKRRAINNLSSNGIRETNFEKIIDSDNSNTAIILFLVPRIILIEQNFRRLLT
jgi:superfamily II DNA or RNA helicase